MLRELVYLLVICIVVGGVWWLVGYMTVPNPLNKLIKVVAIVIGFIDVIQVLLNIAGVPGLL